MRLGPVIVTALIFLLCTGVGIPGVQKLKEASKRMVCSNNCKQISISVENYCSVMGSYPTATMPNEQLKVDQRFSWQFSIVPYIESDNIFGRADKSKAWDDEKNHYSTQLAHHAYSCGYVRDSKSNSFNTTYIGITGVGTESVNFPLEHPDAGIFGLDRKVKPSDVEHPSSTLLILETLTGGPWAQGGYSTVRGIEPSNTFSATSPFGSTHPSGGSYFTPLYGVNAGFADRSVRFVKHTIDQMVLDSLARLKDDKGSIIIE